MPDIRFGEIDFSGDGAFVWGAGQYSAPARSVDFIEVPGRNGDLLIDNGSYTNTKAIFDVVITKDVQENTDRLKYLLYSQKGYQRLYDSDLKGFYRMASFNSGFDIMSTEGGVVRVEFDCKPFKYDVLGEEVVIIPTEGVVNKIYNPYFESSSPLIKIYGNGNGFFYVNGEAMTIYDLDEYLIVDCDLRYAYKVDADGNMVNKNHDIKTTDIQLKPGENEVVFRSSGGGITSVEIFPRWVTL